MERQCAWCGRNLEDPGVPVRGDGTVSHGICDGCYAALSPDRGIPISEFVASLHQPVILMDDEHTIGMANAAALQLVGRSSDGVLGERPGTIFECENAHLSGGCGKTIHCSGCSIRQAVARTFLTGEPQLEIPATLTAVRDPGLEDVRMVISTARVGERVLLRIEEFDA